MHYPVNNIIGKLHNVQILERCDTREEDSDQILMWIIKQGMLSFCSKFAIYPSLEGFQLFA